jgi:flagellar hook-associated protein 2
MASDLALTGVFSGIDSEVLVEQAMAYNRRPLDRLEQQRAAWQEKDQAVAELERRLTTFRSQVDSLRSAETLEKTGAVSLDSDVLTASASAGATEATHQVQVNQLAQAHRLVHDAGLAAETDPVGAEKSTALNTNGVADPDATWFTAGANGATYTFDFDAEADIDNVAFAADTAYTMNEVAALINARSQAVSGYDAASVEADSQTGKSYLRLSAQSSDTAGTMTQTLAAGDAVDELDDEDDWTKTAAGTGEFVYTYDGTTRAVVLTEGATLANLRDLINNDAQNPGVSASILEYDSAYHLVLAGRDTGADYALAIDHLATTIDGFDTPDFVETQAAQNSQFRVDGYPAGDWIERNANTVSDVIPHVTLTARTTGTTSVSISRDTSLLRSDLENLAAVYNGLVDKIGLYAGYDTETESGGVLQGDTSITHLMDALRSGITAPVAGFTTDTDPFTLASQIGLHFGQADDSGMPVMEDVGKLFYDADTLEEALASDYRGVLELIGGWGKGSSDSEDILFDGAHESTAGGTYEVRVDFNASGAVTLAMIRNEGETSWRNLDISGTELSGQEGNPEQYLQLNTVWDGSGAYTATATVRVQRGFAHLLYDRAAAILDEATGALAAKRDHYDSAIESLDRNIQTQERLLETRRQHLEDKYARLEATLARLDAQRGAFEAMMTALDSFNGRSEND